MLITISMLILIWLFCEFKLSRADGSFIKNIHPYRQILNHILPSRNESVVYFDEYIDARELKKYLEKAREEFPVDITHCVVAACASTLAKNPSMNRFASGRRLYQRKGRFLSFSMKRKKLNKKAKLAAVKMQVPDQMSFKEFCQAVDKKINYERSGKKTYADKEFNLLSFIPRTLMQFFVSSMKLADYYNLLPNSFIKNDPMFTSMFIANLGSLNMRAGYHHLYEWGNSSHFIMIGRLENRPTLVDGQYVPRETLHLRCSYDERIEDGLTAGIGIETIKEVLEHPFQLLGCLEKNGKDKYLLNGRGLTQAESQKEQEKRQKEKEAIKPQRVPVV